MVASESKIAFDEGEMRHVSADTGGFIPSSSVVGQCSRLSRSRKSRPWPQQTEAPYGTPPCARLFKIASLQQFVLPFVCSGVDR